MPDQPARTTGRALYWDDVYEGSGPDAVRWYQAEPSVSLELIELLG